MKKIVLVLMMAAMMLTAPAFACDKKLATKLMNSMALDGTWDELTGKRSTRVLFYWGPAWDYYTIEDRKRMVMAFAAADACLAGHGRKISFYYETKLVAEAIPREGVFLR